MTHKLAHRFKVFTILDNFDPPRFERRGVMDLRNMNLQGILADGEYEDYQTTKQFKISGKATELGNLMLVELENVDNPGESWSGLKIFEKGDTVKVAGTRTVRSEILAAQDEEPWLITKP